MKIESQGFEDIEPIAFIPFVYEDFVDSECIVEAIMYPPLKSEQTLTILNPPIEHEEDEEIAESGHFFSNYQSSEPSIKKEEDKENKENLHVKENLMRPAPVIRAPLSTRKIGKKKTKRPIFCRHCNKTFWAKPTAKKSFHVVNHQCSGNPRLQFTVNARNRHRRCHVNHEPPCLIWGDPEKAVRKPGKSRDPLKKIVKRKVQAKLVDPLKIEGNDYDDEWLP
jgi:hypothetical protein